jgi:hypothetical protein
MNEEHVRARSAVESLRSGVPSRHAVEQLGTTQQEAVQEFEARLQQVAQGQGTEPLVLSAGFGVGKSHLLEYLRILAAGRRFVCASIVVSPETPLGNAHLVLKAIAEAAEAPGRTGRALRALASDFGADSDSFANLRLWARDTELDDRFAALLLLYDELRGDEEFRARILDDIEGSPVPLGDIRKKLRELKQLAGFSLKSTRQALLAHDRIRLLARFYRACTGKGLVVFFDELERLAAFPPRQREAAWRELAWWRKTARNPSDAVLPVFAVAPGLLNTEKDELQAEAGSPVLEGIGMVNGAVPLSRPTAEEREKIYYRVRQIYEQAYGGPVPEIERERQGPVTTIRSEIRRWLTLWDMGRYYPDYAPQVIEEDLKVSTEPIDEEVFSTDDGAGE